MRRVEFLTEGEEVDFSLDLPDDVAGWVPWVFLARWQATKADRGFSGAWRARLFRRAGRGEA